MSGKIKFGDVFNKVNIILRSEKIKEYASEEDFLDKVFEKYVFFCKSKNIPIGFKDSEKFQIKFRSFLKDPIMVTLFFNNYFSNNWNDTFAKFYMLVVNKPKESKEKSVPQVRE